MGASDWGDRSRSARAPIRDGGRNDSSSSSGASGPAAGQGQSGGPRPIVVSVTPVRRADFPIILESLGQVQAYNNVLVRARVDGEIVKIAFSEGQMVKAGDLLAQIDPRPFQATLDQAIAKRAQDEANLANAKLDQARYATLAKQNFATQQQLDTQNSLVTQLTASIAADAATIDAAKVQLNYTTIRAPISGRVGFRLIDEGNLVNAGQQTGIVTIAQLQPISVIFTEPQEYVESNQPRACPGPAASDRQERRGRKACRRQARRKRQSGRRRDRDDPLEGGIREQGQRALAGARGNHKLAGRSRQERARHSRGRRSAWAGRPLRFRCRRSEPSHDPAGQGLASKHRDRRRLRRPEGGRKGRDDGRVPAAAGNPSRNRRAGRGSRAGDWHFGSLHPQACRHHSADGRHPAGRPGGVSLAARRSATAGRLSDDFRFGRASGRLSRNHGDLGGATARAANRADSGRLANDVDELARRDRDYRSVRPRPQHRRRRQRHPGGDQCRVGTVAERPAEPAHVSQGQPVRHADSHPLREIGRCADYRCRRRGGKHSRPAHQPDLRRIAGACRRPADAGHSHPDRSGEAR